MIHDDTHLNRIDFAGHLRTLSSMSSYVCKVLQNCEACPAYGVTPLHLRTEIGVCTAPVLCGTYKNSKCFNEQLCRQSLNATPSIVHCECRKDHYYDDATRQCQNANKDSVVAHILYWLVFLPIAFTGLVILPRDGPSAKRTSTLMMRKTLGWKVISPPQFLSHRASRRNGVNQHAGGASFRIW